MFTISFTVYNHVYNYNRTCKNFLNNYYNIMFIIVKIASQGPFKGTVFYGIVIMILVGMFHLEELIDMLSIGKSLLYVCWCGNSI